MTPRISPERLLDDLAALAAIGGRPDGGVDRVAGSAADRQARAWLADRMRDAGLDARIDAAGNVLGRRPRTRGPWLLAGSHSDTVPAGGRLDGAYGVVAALEVARALGEAAHPGADALEVVSFADEEGVGSGGGLLGSSHLAESEHVRELTGYLELHIEQGPRLEAEGLDLGVVTGIVGVERWDVVFRGAANHAGTTPWSMRRDAAAAAGRLLHSLRPLLTAIDPELAGNAGVLELLPGSPNVVAGEARAVLEVRSVHVGALRAAEAALREEARSAAAEAGCSVDFTARSASLPVDMDAAFVEAAAAACAESGLGWRRLVSGAGHDAAVMAAHVPAAMLFVPSRDGVSHSPLEFTAPAQLVSGCLVFLRTVLKCLEIQQIDS